MKTSIPAAILAAYIGFGLIPATASAAPILQLYVEGSTYDQTHESWVFAPNTGDPIRLWVIGNVSGPGGAGTISDVKLSIVYADPGSLVTISLTGSKTNGYGGVTDPSTAPDGNYLRTVDDGSTPTLGGGSSLSPHGVYGAGNEWQEFALGDFGLTDSPIADVVNTFPTSFTDNAGQINAYELTVSDNVTDLHIDVYGNVVSGNRAKYVFAPYSHDAGTGVNMRVPEPGTLGLFVIGLLGLGVIARRRFG